MDEDSAKLFRIQVHAQFHSMSGGSQTRRQCSDDPERMVRFLVTTR